MQSILNNINNQPLCEIPNITENNYIDIARLIYDTDQYISEAIFQNQAQAEIIIPELIKINDAMFNAKNLFVAVDNDKIIGTILWHKGTLNWTMKSFSNVAKQYGMKLTDYVLKAENEYFASYAETDNEVISILDLCIDKTMRGKGIGNSLLESFIQEHINECEAFELHVLEENKPAIALYEKLGFKVIDRIQGFSIDDRELPCLKMKL